MGRIICCGLGPGDPDLMSVRADRIVRSARHVAYFRKKGQSGQARRIVDGLLAADVSEYPMEYPVTTEIAFDNPEYARLLADFYDAWAERLARLTDQHREDPTKPGPEAIAGRLLELIEAPVANARLSAVRRSVGTRVVLSLAKAASETATGSIAASRLEQALYDWARAQTTRRFADPDDRAWALATARMVLDREALAAAVKGDDTGRKIPPGMPIGTDEN